MKRLQKESGSKEEFPGGVDLAHFAKSCRIAPNAKVGLAELSTLVLGRRLNEVHVSTHWEDQNLSEEQIQYASLDAYASQAIYNRLLEIERLGNIPENVPHDLPVTVYQEDGQKVIAHGIWSKLNFENNPILDGVDFQTSENIRLVAVEIQKITIPAAIIKSHHQHALKDFGLLPFTIICK